MGCGCKGSSYEPPSSQQSMKAAKTPRKVTTIDASYYSTPVYNGPQPKTAKKD